MWTPGDGWSKAVRMAEGFGQSALSLLRSYASLSGHARFLVVGARSSHPFPSRTRS